MNWKEIIIKEGLRNYISWGCKGRESYYCIYEVECLRFEKGEVSLVVGFKVFIFKFIIIVIMLMVLK